MATLLLSLKNEKKIPFVPVDPSHVRFYVCGPTVYAPPHLGNLRPVAVFDVLFRILRALYPKVTYVRNITDIDDKIIQQSVAKRAPIHTITQEALATFHTFTHALGALSPTYEPFATAWVQEMLVLITTLIQKGNAYEAAGHVMFDTQSFASYGALSGTNASCLQAGARVEVAPYKRSPCDFILWKPAKPGEPFWESPFGKGRPGWHTECCVMAKGLLGIPFDLHGGGNDLLFPHHENEVAQAWCGYETQKMATYWVHNAFVRMQGNKMAKSEGNGIDVAALLERWKGEVLRFVLLSSHYKSPLDWSKALLYQAERCITRFYGALREANFAEEHPGQEGDWKAVPKAFQKALLQDMNTPLALTLLQEYAKSIFRETQSEEKKSQARVLYNAGKFLGFFHTTWNEWFQKLDPKDGVDVLWIEALIARRTKARLQGNYQEADALRTILEAQGIEVEDKKEGVSWHLKKERGE